MRQYRMTSTYVENTKKLELNLVKRWDDLHIRGEYSTFTLLSKSFLG